MGCRSRWRSALPCQCSQQTRRGLGQAADELLSIQGVECSFVMFPMDTQIIISARSLGDINVQMILEPLGGGGNPAMAGAQISGKQMSAVITELVSSIDQYFDD